MAHVEGFPDKDGIDTLVKLGKRMCSIVALFAPLLHKKYPDNELIPLLLAAIATVCNLLPEIESEFLIDTGLNNEPIENPTGVPGLDSGADPSLPPDYEPL